MSKVDLFDEQCPKPEILSEQEQIALLTGLGNHEAKLLTAVMMVSQPGRTFTETQLVNGLRDGQGDSPGWTPRGSVPLGYCRNSLEPIGAVVEEQVKGRSGPMTAYRASEFGAKWGLAFAGALLDWSLDNPDHSLIQIFGSTSSSSDVRSPEVRYRIYTELLTAPSATISYGEIAEASETETIDKKLLDDQLRNMAELGIVEIKSVQAAYNPLLKILNPHFKHVAYTFESLKPETKAIYRAMQTLHGRGEVEVSLDTLVTQAMEAFPGLDIHTLRKKLPQNIHSYTKNFPGLELVDRGGIPESKRTDVVLNSNLVEPLTDLCSAIENVFSGSGLEVYAEKARQIISDPVAFAALMGKVKRFSPNIIAQTEGREVLNERLFSILRKLGQSSLKQIRDELELQGRRMSAEGIRTALQPLVHSGELGLDKIPIMPTNKAKFNHYSLKSYESSPK